MNDSRPPDSSSSPNQSPNPSVNSSANEKKNSRKQILIRASIAVGLLAAIGCVAITLWLVRLNHSIAVRFSEKRFAPPVEFYSAAERIRRGSIYPAHYFENFLTNKNFRKRDFGQPIQSGDFSIWDGSECTSLVGVPVQAPAPTPGAVASSLTDANPNSTLTAQPTPLPEPSINHCVAFKSVAHVANPNQSTTEAQVQVIALADDGKVLGVYAGDPPRAVESVRIEPELFAQYYGENPVLRKIVTLGETPTNCLNALMAIEDSKFLEHSGVNLTSLARALLVDLRSGRRAQGGSTITQQLVKNYFLTEERTFSRKITEIAMAYLVERQVSKDDILETYINLIYMGQNGPFQVRGFAAASEHYFNKPLNSLSLDQCAMVAAILNSPGLYNPFHNPERAQSRRSLVLDRMASLKMITVDEAKEAKASPLPLRPQQILTEPAPYYVQAVRREIAARKIDESEGLRVYTSLNLRAQEAAQQAVRSGLAALEKSNSTVKKLKASGKNLEALLLSSDPDTGEIQALVGGRGYQATQFNRAIDSRRQVGSVMKPFTYLTALLNQAPDGKPYTPLTLLRDEATVHKFDGQTWTPANYERTYNGAVPLFFALKESLNAATVNLGIDVGLGNIIDTARKLGINSRIEKYPSLTLGSFELAPIEVLGAYGTLSKMGDYAPLTLLDHIEDLKGA